MTKKNIQPQNKETKESDTMVSVPSSLIESLAENKKISKHGSSATVVAVVGASAALLAGAATAIIGGYYNLQIERYKAEAEATATTRQQQFEILVRATQDRSAKEAAKNLMFFADVGIFDESFAEKIRVMADQPLSLPVLRSSIDNLGIPFKPLSEKFQPSIPSSDTSARISTIMIEHLGVSPEIISSQAKLVSDLGADELDWVELTMALEEEFGIEIPNNEALMMGTVGNVEKIVQFKLDAQ